MSSRDSTPPPVERIEAAAYTIPTDAPESDGTLEWDSTTMVLVHAYGGGRTGMGYTYAGPAAAAVVTDKLAGVVRGRDATAPAASWAALHHAVRNLGRPGLVAEAVSAVDVALWDLHARLLDVPLTVALGAVHDTVPVYGSGGFTSYADDRLRSQLGGWAQAGIPRVKMKVGRDPDADLGRLRAAREAIGDAQLFVDANGAYTRKQALWWAQRFAEFDVGWLEEPVSSDDLAGLRLLRDADRAAWTSPRGSTATTCPTSSTCSTPARWTACRPTSPAAAGSARWPGWRRCATRAASTCRCTAPRRSLRTPARPSGTCGT